MLVALLAVVYVWGAYRTWEIACVVMREDLPRQAARESAAAVAMVLAASTALWPVLWAATAWEWFREWRAWRKRGG
jgi:hypothetical protein